MRLINFVMSNDKSPLQRGFAGRHPILANLAIIVLIAFIGIWIIYFAIAIFTKHGESDVVPSVENMSYTEAIRVLHDHGFRVDIRDSLYTDNVKPGFVIEQFPKSNSVVKPGRKIFLYINAVNPKEVVIDEDNNPREDALRGFSFRNGMARLEELGCKNIQVVRVLGDNDCIVRVIANGHTVKKTESIPVNSKIIVEVYDGRLEALRDSLSEIEYRRTTGQSYESVYYQDPVTNTESDEEPAEEYEYIE